MIDTDTETNRKKRSRNEVRILLPVGYLKVIDDGLCPHVSHTLHGINQHYHAKILEGIHATIRLLESMDGEWRKYCPECESKIDPVFHIPYDQDLFNELNTPFFSLSKSGKIQYGHGSGTHDDMFWAIGLSLRLGGSETLKPIAKK